jgi:glycosyltransferase involved in cell wall biosynthesis
MNILAVIPYVPTPIRVRPYCLLRVLAQRGHHITLATVWENESELKALDEIKSWGIDLLSAPLTRNQKLKNIARALPTRSPLQAWFCYVPELARVIEAHLKQSTTDIVHVEHLRGAQYALQAQSPISNLQSPIPVVWDSVDCITHLFEQASQRSRSLKSRAMTAVELGRTRYYEGWLTEQFAHVLVTSDTDKMALQKLARNPNPISTLGNGVDLNYFAPSNEKNDKRQPDTIVFSGKMSYHANVTAALYLAQEVMPIVWRSRPNTKLVIAGSRPTPAVQALEANEPGARIRVTGYVKDLRVPLRQASIAAAPLLYGAGVQNKVLEAMACGTPVVASPQAINALKVERGVDCLVADTPQAFAESLITLLNDEALRAKMGAAGRRFVETHHNWDDIVAQLEHIYERSMQDVRESNYSKQTQHTDSQSRQPVFSATQS